MKVLIVLFILLSLPELNKNQIKSDFQGYNMFNGHVKARLKTKIENLIFQLEFLNNLNLKSSNFIFNFFFLESYILRILRPKTYITLTIS